MIVYFALIHPLSLQYKKKSIQYQTVEIITSKYIHVILLTLPNDVPIHYVVIE